MLGRDGPEEGKGGFEVPLHIASRVDDWADHPAFAGVVRPRTDDRYASLEGDLVEPRFPVAGGRSRPFGRNDKHEILMGIKLSDDRAHQVLRGASVDRHPAQRAHEPAHGPFEEAVLADEASLPAKRVD